MTRWLALSLFAALVGCRATLPRPTPPLTRTPDAPFRASPPPLSPVRAPRVEVRTATRADGLAVHWVARPGPITALGWYAPRGLARLHPPGMLETFVRAQGLRLEGAPGVRKVGIRAGLDGLQIRVEVPSADARREAASLAAIVGTLPGERYLERAKRIVKNKLRKESFGSPEVARRLMWGGLFSERHPLATLPHDLARAVSSVSRADLEELMPRFIRGPRAVAVVGPEAEAVAKVLLAQVPIAGSMPVGPAASPPSTAARPLRIRVVRRRGAPWVEFAFPVLGAGPEAPEAELAAHLLGGSIAGRLGDALRLDTGHSYALVANYQANEGFGVLRLAGDVGEDDVPLFIERVVEVVSSLRMGAVSAEELEAARARWRGALAADLSVSRRGVHRLLQAARRGPPDFAARARAIDAVEPAGLLAWAQASLRVDLGQAIVFAPEQALTPLMLLGDAEQVRLEPF